MSSMTLIKPRDELSLRSVRDQAKQCEGSAPLSVGTSL